MIELLNSRFVNAWVLAKDLERMRDDPTLESRIRALAGRLLAGYRYPVDTHILSPDGEGLGRVAAHDLPGEEESAAYVEVLRRALGESGPRRGGS